MDIKYLNITSLNDFYNLMFYTRDIKKSIVNDILNNKICNSEMIDLLIDALEILNNLPGNQYEKIINHHNTQVKLNLFYEISELQKDIYYLLHKEQDFYEYLSNLNPNFFKQLADGKDFLVNNKFKNLISDRDGTVNNYCGRYNSSIQSIYNAVFLSRYAIYSADNAVILTSAPLKNVGLLDMSVSPDNLFIYAGSKGREYLDKNNNKHYLSIDSEKQKILDKLNNEIDNLLNNEEYQIFALIGSGFQKKFGQTTIARQDIYNSIPPDISESFFNQIINLVNYIDPTKKYLSIEDTGLDIEIILNINNEDNELKDFDKGDGIEFLDRNIPLNINELGAIICGDTKSDIPMLTTAIKKTNKVAAIFVTNDDNLKESINNICANSYFVSSPDILVTILNEINK
ncbi:MAG TPA: hypothetical protein PLC96_07605 [Bacteroidales bacterium]|jgi:hypothetical protein|nr:trehalose 6-phosphate synthase [Bacteroidales bacterium]HPZ61824.1 hypothetical protein [Bacteroidales bacterium]